MDELFRMITLRHPKPAAIQKSINLATNTSFQKSLSVKGSVNRKWELMERQSVQFESDAAYVAGLADLTYGAGITAFYTALGDPPPSDFSHAKLQAMVSAAFGADSKTLVASANFVADYERLCDTIVACFIATTSGTILSDCVKGVRLYDLIQRDASGDSALDNQGDPLKGLTKPIVLPSPIFPVDPNPITPAGIGDLLIIKQHILRYEAADIAYVENILSGETRVHSEKHDLTTIQTSLTENEVTTVTIKDLQTTDQTSLKTETQNAISQSVNAQAGVAISASYGTLKINTNASVGYSDAQQSSNDVATEAAHQVVDQAASNVTNRTLTQQTTSTTEKSRQDDSHSFANPSPNPDVVGVYQWVNEIDRAQVFNYGIRQLFDLIVPEPAAFLLDAATTSAAASTAPVVPQPLPFILTPDQLNEDPTNANYFGKFAVQYGAVGIPAQPAPSITVTKAFVTSDPSSNGQGSADITIPDNYAAVNAWVQATYNYKDDKAKSGISVFVGTASYGMTAQVETPANQNPLDLSVNPATHHEAKNISVAIHSYGATDYAVVVDVLCNLTGQAKAAWKQTVFDTIYTAYQAQLKQYNDSLAQQTFFKPTVAPLGSDDATQNRQTERTEIKKSCIAMLSNLNLLTFSGIEQDGAPPAAGNQAFPRVNWPNSVDAPLDVLSQGSLIRFFEEAFEWEEMMYLFYPYFWGRKTSWYENALLTNSDALFQQFLSAGAARAVIPVRQGFENAVAYYMVRQRPWTGGVLPTVTDPTYLPIAQEIEDAEGGPDNEVPVNAPWEVTIPTTQTILTGSTLPSWEQPDPTQWVWQPSDSLAAKSGGPP